MSYSNDGQGEPKYFQAHHSTKKAPGGVSRVEVWSTKRQTDKQTVKQVLRHTNKQTI